MTLENFHWNKEDYFPYLMQNNRNAVLALEYLVDDLHSGKDVTIDKFLSHYGSEDFLWSLVKLMSSTDARISGNSAYVLGTIAETENGTIRIIELLNNNINEEAKKILPYMINMLKSNDAECLMNAAGTIGTISESKLGRDWLLSQSSLNEVIQLCTQLLDHQNLWVSSNAALVLARISIEDAGCKALLNYDMSQATLKKLINALGNDDAGRGMNCAFAIGRICDNEEGRNAFLKLNKEMTKLINSLIIMIEQNRDYGCTKNACFALSCLAGNDKAHDIIINHDSFEKLINSLCNLLVKVTDTETQWFASMLIRVLASFSYGCVKLRSLNIVENTIKSLLEKPNLFNDVKEEIDITLEFLKRLEKPSPPKVQSVASTEIEFYWDEVILKNKLHVQYLLFNQTDCVYSGSETSFKVTNLNPYTQYTFHLQLCTVEDGDKSPVSDIVEVFTEESLPTEPLNLKCGGATTTLLKVVWDPPEKMNGLLKGYCIYNGTLFIEQTNDLMYILTGLTPGTSYEIQVCASTSKGKGAKASLKASTCELGDLTPEKPTFATVGRREILIRWAAPEVIAGRLNKYDLLMNGKSVYSGIELEHKIIMLKPDTEYKFEVVAVTTEGKFKSKVAKARTLKDEYDPERAPLYPGPQVLQAPQIPSALLLSTDSNKKRMSTEIESQNKPFSRQKTKLKLSREPTKINKEKITTIDCEDFSKCTFTESTASLPPVNTLQNNEDLVTNRILRNNSSNLPLNSNSTNNLPVRPPLYSLIPRTKETPTVLRTGTFHLNKQLNTQKSKNMKSNTLEAFQNNLNLKNTTYLNPFERAKTMGFGNQKSTNRKLSDTTNVHPSFLYVKDLQPEFPSLPSNQLVPYLNVMNSTHHNSTETVKITPILTTTTTTTNIIDTKNEHNRTINSFVPMQYRYLFRRLQKERPMQLDELTAVMRANTFISTGDQYRSPRLTK